MMNPESNYEIKKRLERELQDIAVARAIIHAKQYTTSALSKEFDVLCEQDKTLSIRQCAAKFKLHNLDNGMPMLGEPLPHNNVIDANGNKPSNQ